MSDERQVLNVNSENNNNSPNEERLPVLSPKYQDPLNPFELECHKCKRTISTIVQNKIGSGTWVCALLWCNLFFIPGLIPFCVKKCQDQVHNCPECGTKLYQYYYEPCNLDKK